MKKTTMMILTAFVLVLFAAPVAQAEDGAVVFKAKCAACHGADGKGDTTMGKKQGLRDLGSAEVQAQSDAELTEVIANGNGKPAHAYSKKGVTADQVKALVAHIRTLKK
ncbi:MAG: cytochrome c [Thermoanaerobaculia bacterium]